MIIKVIIVVKALLFKQITIIVKRLKLNLLYQFIINQWYQYLKAFIITTIVKNFIVMLLIIDQEELKHFIIITNQYY